MPAVGILKKPPHPDPPPLVDRVKPPRPPKPKRGIPPPPPRVVEISKSQDVTIADEDEPTTEESYDYKDIDFASDIFDWRIPPPRPKPPRFQANGFAHKVSDSLPVVESDVRTVANDTCQSTIEQRIEPVVEEEVTSKTDEKAEVGEARLKADKLALFMLEHEGKELTMEDVRQLELLLDEAEGEERGDEQTHISAVLGDAYDEECHKYDEDLNGDAGDQEYDGEGESHLDGSDAVMQKCNGEGLMRNEETRGTGKVACVRFSDENGLDLESRDVRGEIPDEEMVEGRPVRHSDYGIVQFFHDHRKRSPKTSKAKDSGMYEPVGRQDLRFVRPDMSGFKPPEPSDVGDPFSWRRREKNHQYLYGYESMDRSEEHIPAMDKILDGCQEVEEMIKARDLTPPGMLFDSLGRKKRVRKVRPPSPPPRPPPPVPPKLRTPSPLPPIPTEPNGDAEEQKVEGDDNMQIDLERELEMEKQILTDLSFVESLVGSVAVKEDVLVAGSFGDGSRDLTAVPQNGIAEADVEDLIVPMDASSFLTGDVVETADNVKFISDMEPLTLPSDAGANGLLHNGVDEKADGEIQLEEVIQVAPRRASRRDTARGRPPRPIPPCMVARPIPPERRKRVASAEPPLTAFEREQVDLMQQREFVAPPRNKAKRSVSFHTAEEIRKRIDVQAQNYLRTPRRKDRLSCTYMATPPSASATLTYGSLRRNHRRPLTPVYSHINKDVLRRKETGVQTNGVDDYEGNEDTESLPPIPPPKLKDVEMLIIHDKDGAVDPITTPEPVRMDLDDSEVPAEFLATEALPGADVPETQNTSESTVDDSVVPQDFLTLSKPQDNVITKTPEFETDGERTIPTSELKPEPETNLTLSSTRPLPPPPPPPRHRGIKEKYITLDGPVVMTGIVPKGDEGLASGKMAILPDLKVLRLSVVQLDASMIRVGQIQAEHMIAHRLDTLGSSRTPTPTSQRPPDPDPGKEDGNRQTGNEVIAPRQPGQESSTTESGVDKSNEIGKKDSEVETTGSTGCGITNFDQVGIRPEPQSAPEPESPPIPENLTQQLQAPPAFEPTHIRVASPVEGFNVWDDEYAQDRVECASPTNTVTSTTSGSASYVTCDETLHEDSDITPDGLDAGSIDGDFGFGLDEDEDIDGRGTGCSTPTEMATIGSDIPLAAMLTDSGLPPIFAPPFESPYLPAPTSALHLHDHQPMDTDTDENFNSFGGTDSRDPSNTIGI